MTTTALIAPAAAPVQAAAKTAPRLSFRRVLDAEWTKIRTVRSTVWTLVALVVASVGITAMITSLAAADIASGEAGESPGSFVTYGVMFGQVAAAVLGVLVATSEYSSGMIRTTLAATPRRWSIVAAKGLVLGSMLLVLGTLTTVASYLVGNFFLDREGIGLALDDPGVLRALLGGGLYLAMLGLFGFALGLLLRHTAGAVTVVLALIFVVGNVVMLIPGTLGEWLTKLMPGNAGSEIAMVESFNPMLLEPWAGFAVFSAETAVLLAIAGVLFSRRDA
jgi:ABC-2 type transport system permease protein